MQSSPCRSTLRPSASWPRWSRLFGESGSRRVPKKKKRAGTAARPRERRHPTSGAKKDAPAAPIRRGQTQHR